MFGRRKRNRQPDIDDYTVEPMEPRVLLSADALGVDAGVLDTDSATQNDWDLKDANDWARSLANHDETNSAPLPEADTSDTRTEIVFLDTGVEDGQQLLADLLSRDGMNITQVHLIDANSDGVDQITQVLAGRQSVDAIHILSHGAAGQIQLGSGTLSTGSLDGYAGQLNDWGGALADAGDILIYGCDLAAGDQGETLVNAIGVLTGADVAASVDQTGHAAQGADWDLEYRAGEVETVGFTMVGLPVWQGTLATFTVDIIADTVDDNLGDGIAEDASGNTSLRAAIMEANALGGMDLIRFQITDPLVGGEHIIQLSNVLPTLTITETIVIDATTDDDHAGTPVIRLDGSITTGSDGLVLGAGSDGSTIRGLSVTDFDGAAIAITSDNNQIAGNYLGVRPDGVSPGGNLTGVYITGGLGNMIGGTDAADRNVISGNNGSGIALVGVGTVSNLIQGNYIGTDASGLLDLGNSRNGIVIDDADNNQIGGSTAASRNVISGNAWDGIYLVGGADATVIQGNYIGTDATGLSKLQNDLNGIYVADNATDGTRIGGAAPGAGNLISGNSQTGILLVSADFNVVYGNFIGTDVRGVGSLGNGYAGIRMELISTDNTIGGTNPGEANLIAFNSNDGVHVGAERNSVRGNEIFGNSAPSDIHLGAGGNPGAVQPVVSNAISGLGLTTVTISVSGASGGNPYEVDLFSNITGANEGQVFLGTVTVTGGLQVVVLNTEVMDNHYITATATNTVGSAETSEFCSATQVTGPGSVNTAPVLDPTNDLAFVPFVPNSGPPLGAVGTLISTLVDLPGGGGQDNVTDPDVGAVPGIAVIAADASNGTWHYSTNDGANWSLLGAVSIDSAQLLAADAGTRIYFEPDPAFSDPIAEAIYFRAWDGTDGSNGDAGADTTVHGGTTAFSEVFDSVSIGVDRAPVFTGIGPFAIDENSTSGSVVGDVDANDGAGGGADVGVTYGITTNLDSDGDGRKAFAIDSLTGVITVNDADDLNYEDNASMAITVEANDGSTTASTNVTINLNNVNEAPSVSVPSSVFINEIHYDNMGVDTGEAIEIAGVAGNDLNGWSLVMYNGFDGTVYDTVNLTGTLPNQADNFGTLVFNMPVDGIQNATGAPDGIALVDATGAVVQFLSYEGAFTAVEGPANGMLSTDIGVSEDNGSTAIGDSLQLIGAGTTFTWATAASETFGSVNTGQDFAALAAATNQTINEESSLVFSTGNGNAIVVGDVDAALSAAPDPVSVTLSVGNGTLTLGSTAGLGSLVGDGTGTMTFNGTVAELNAAMEGLTYQPNTNFNGSETLNVLVDDLGNEGLGGSQTAVGTVFITVDPVNDAPTATNLTTTSGYNEGDASVAITDIVVSDVDVGETITATLTLANTSTGSLSANDGATYTAGTGVWTITNTVANVNTALANLVFSPTVNNETDTTIGVVIDDNDEDGSGPLSGTITLDVTPVNDAPTATNLTTTSGYNEGDASVAITDIVVSDVDAGETITATLTLVDTSTGSLSANDGATYTAGTGVWTITNTVANVNTALANLVFSPTVNNETDTTIGVVIDDNDEDGSGPLSGTITLDVTPVNDAPTATNLTTTSGYNEGDVSVAITNIVVSDVDAGETITATLTLVDTSTGSLSANDGATYTAGTGVWTITNTVANVNTALANLVFSPTVNNETDTTIGVVIDDNDEDGSGPLSGTITLDVTPVNDAPTATNLTTTSSYNEGDASVAITNIVVSDVDAGETITATLTLADTSTGSLSANDGASYTAGTGVWTITNTVANVNTALANLVFSPLVNNETDTTIGVVIDDNDEDGSGPLSGTITLDVTPVNTAPTLDNPISDQSTVEDAAFSFRFAGTTFSDVDVGDTLTYSALQSGGAALPGWLNFDAATRTFSGVPLDGDVGAITIEVRATDGSGASVNDSFVLTVTNVNDAPVLGNNEMTLGPGDKVTLTTAMLSASDLDHADGGLAFTVSSVTGGQFELAGTPGTGITSFTLAQIAAGDVVFVDDGDEVAPTYSVSVGDSMVNVGPIAANIVFNVPVVTPTLPVVPVVPGPVDGGPDTQTTDEDAESEPETGDAGEETTETETTAEGGPGGEDEPRSLTTATDNTLTGPLGVSGFDASDRAERNSLQGMLKNMFARPAALLAMSAQYAVPSAFEVNAIAAQVRAVLVSSEFNSSIDRMREDVSDATVFHHSVVGSGVAVTTGLSVGYVAWLVRGGVLLSTALSSLPAWQFIDPLPVLARTRDDDDLGGSDDSLQSIIKEQAARDAREIKDSNGDAEAGETLAGDEQT